MIHDIYVEVLGSINNGYRMKVDVIDLGFYMFGWTARRSDKNTGGWWVQPPAVNVNGKWKLTVEFNKSLTLWQEIEKSCIQAVKDYETSPQDAVITDEDLSDEAISKGLDEAFDNLDQGDKPSGKAIPWLNEDDPNE